MKFIKNLIFITIVIFTTYFCDYLLFSLSNEKIQNEALTILKTYDYNLKDLDKLIKNSSNVKHYKDFFSKNIDHNYKKLKFKILVNNNVYTID